MDWPEVFEKLLYTWSHTCLIHSSDILMHYTNPVHFEKQTNANQCIVLSSRLLFLMYTTLIRL